MTGKPPTPNTPHCALCKDTGLLPDWHPLYEAGLMYCGCWSGFVVQTKAIDDELRAAEADRD